MAQSRLPSCTPAAEAPLNPRPDGGGRWGGWKGLEPGPPAGRGLTQIISIICVCLANIVHVCSQRFVKESLTTKFKNCRKRSASEEVQTKKRKKSCLQNYLPAKTDNNMETEFLVRKMKDEGHMMDEHEVIWGE